MGLDTTNLELRRRDPSIRQWYVNNRGFGEDQPMDFYLFAEGTDGVEYLKDELPKLESRVANLALTQDPEIAIMLEVQQFVESLLLVTNLAHLEEIPESEAVQVNASADLDRLIDIACVQLEKIESRFMGISLDEATAIIVEIRKVIDELSAKYRELGFL